MALLLLALSRFLPADQFQWALAGSLAGAATLLLIGGVYAIVARRRSGREWLGFKATRTRQEIATILASVYRLGPEAIGQMMEQDAHFSRNAQQFLIDHDYPYPRPLHDDTGRYVFASTGKIERLTKALLRSISTAQDNELFLLVVDLLEVDEINPLLDAIRVARARHHEVVIALPWPAELDEPDTDHAPTSGTATPLDLVEHYFTSYRQLAKTLQPLGVSLLLARPGRPAQQLVQRVEALRAARIRARR
jgi:hypothetical protein